MTHYTEADVALSDRHIAAGEARIVQQETLLTALGVRNQSTDVARDLLRQLNVTLAEHRKHRVAIVAAIEDAARSVLPRSR